MDRKRLFQICTGALLMAGCSSATAPNPHQLSNLSAQGWLNLPSGRATLTENDISGKALFVEFWATW